MKQLTNFYKDVLALDSVNQQLPISETFINFKLENGTPVLYIIGLAFPNYVEAGDSLESFVIPVNEIQKMADEIKELLVAYQVVPKIEYNEFNFKFDLQIDVPNNEGDFWICRIELADFDIGNDAIGREDFQLDSLMFEECDFIDPTQTYLASQQREILTQFGYDVSSIDSIVSSDFEKLRQEHLELFNKINQYKNGLMFPLTLSAIKSYVAYRAYVNGTTYLQPDSMSNNDFVRVFATLLGRFENQSQLHFIGYEGELLDVELSLTSEPEAPAINYEDNSDDEVSPDEQLELDMADFKERMRELQEAIWIGSIEDEIDQNDLENIYRLKHAIQNAQTEKALSLLHDHLVTLGIVEAECELCSRLKVTPKL